MNFSKDFNQDLWATWEAIASDALELGDLSNEEAIELCLDAGRLGMFGSTESQAELKTLIQQYGWAAVQEEVAKKFRLI